MRIHLIPGLGADARIFSRIELPGHDIIAHEWPVMPRDSGLQDFAKALARHVDARTPHVLVGVSMGGMVAQEMATLTRPKGVVIVSSWKRPHEMPAPIRLLRGTHPERMLNKAFLERMLPFVRWQMGIEKPDEVELFNSLIGVHGVEQLRVQIAAVLNWEGPPQLPCRLVHIHGDKDRLMPLKGCIADAVVVRGGAHFMVYSKAAAVSRALREAVIAFRA